MFVLKSSNLTHHHQHKQRSNEIEEFIKGMPITMTTHSLMQITTQTFKISTDKFYYHNRKLWYEKAELKDIIKDLDYNNNETRLIPFPLEDNQLPDILMTSTPKMIADFKAFGENQFISFDITYNLIK